MDQTSHVLEYKCPCCSAGLTFSGSEQNMTCEYCDNSFDLEAVKAYNDETELSEFQWESQTQHEWTEDDHSQLRTFICQSCGGELTTDENTAATFCPYCENPTILPVRLSGNIRPDGVIPFEKTKDDAKAAFIQLCKNKPLLPKNFAKTHRVEKITGIYVPFWLYDCSGTYHGRYRATRVHHWSDAHYRYTRTDHYLLIRRASADFSAIPMDGSTKMDNAVMESVEPYDYTKLVNFESAYLSGYLADKYDVEATEGQKRVEQRVGDTLDDSLQSTFIGYSSVLPTNRQLQVTHGTAKYVLLPVWMLHTWYKDKTYLFAMNGQTGKMTGTFPICPRRSFGWFAGICAAVTAVASLITILVA